MHLSTCTGKPDELGHYKLPSPIGNFVELLFIIELTYLWLEGSLHPYPVMVGYNCHSILELIDLTLN